jgi:hypothetical protein
MISSKYRFQMVVLRLQNQMLEKFKETFFWKLDNRNILICPRPTNGRKDNSSLLILLTVKNFNYFRSITIVSLN